MVDIFNDVLSKRSDYYVRLKDVASEKIEAWKGVAIKAGIDLSMNRFIHRIHGQDVKAITNQYKELLAIVHLVTHEHAAEMKQ